MRLKKSWVYLILATLLITCAVLSYALKKENCKSQTSINAQYISALDSVKEYIPEHIFSSVEGFPDACADYASAVRTLSNEQFNENQKLYIVISMQTLSGPDYFDFAEAALSLYQENKIDYKILRSVFFPLQDYDAPHQWYFWHPTWRDLLKRAAVEVSNDEFNALMYKKLSGETWWQWQEWQSAQQTE